MKKSIEEAAIAFANKCRTANIKGGLDYLYDELDMRNAFEEGAVFGNTVTKEKAIEALSSVLGNWVHGGDADCIIAEFEERLDKQRNINE